MSHACSNLKPSVAGKCRDENGGGALRVVQSNFHYTKLVQLLIRIAIVYLTSFVGSMPRLLGEVVMNM